MLVRTLHWVVPSYSIWGLPFFLFYSTRLAQFLYERPNQGILRSMLCTLMKPLVCTCVRATQHICISHLHLIHMREHRSELSLMNMCAR